MSQNDRWFDRMYERHYRQVLAYCLRRAMMDDAHDAAAEVFLVAWRRRADMPAGRDKTLPWLYGVARNVLRKQRRTAGRYRRLATRVAAVQDPPPLNPDAVVVQRHEYVEVRAAVARLRPADREVLLLSAWEGLSRNEIAGVLGCSRAAVDKRITRAKQRLAKHYEAPTQSKMHRPPASATGGGVSR